jgi:hypothetical protein
MAMKMKKPIVKLEVLKTWESLCTAMTYASEEVCKELLKNEIAGRARRGFLFRIHSRLNKVRAHRERSELMGKVKEN